MRGRSLPCRDWRLDFSVFHITRIWDFVVSSALASPSLRGNCHFASPCPTRPGTHLCVGPYRAFPMWLPAPNLPVLTRGFALALAARTEQLQGTDITLKRMTAGQSRNQTVF